MAEPADVFVTSGYSLFPSFLSLQVLGQFILEWTWRGLSLCTYSVTHNISQKLFQGCIAMPRHHKVIHRCHEVTMTLGLKLVCNTSHVPSR